MIQLENITKTYQVGNAPAIGLKNVSLRLAEGELVALVGPSGSGKTTLLNIAGGLMKPDTGTVQIGNRRLDSMSAEELCRFRLDRIGFVFQDYNLIPTLTAFENVELLPALQRTPVKARKEKVSGILARVGLEKFMDRRPSQMSRGQQQRVAICRALVTRPALVLGDEMTANLDSATGAQLMDLLYELNQEAKITILYSTHDAAMMQRAGRVIRMKDGVIENA